MFEQYLRNPSCVAPFNEFMATFGRALLKLTRSAENSEEEHAVPLVRKIQDLMLKLDILRPCLSSADCTVVESELKVLSGNIFRDTIKTMGKVDVAPVARAISGTDVCLRQQRYENALLLKRTPSMTNEDGEKAARTT